MTFRCFRINIPFQFNVFWHRLWITLWIVGIKDIIEPDICPLSPLSPCLSPKRHTFGEKYWRFCTIRFWNSFYRLLTIILDTLLSNILCVNSTYVDSVSREMFIHYRTSQHCLPATRSGLFVKHIFVRTCLYLHSRYWTDMLIYHFSSKTWIFRLVCQ